VTIYKYNNIHINGNNSLEHTGKTIAQTMQVIRYLKNIVDEILNTTKDIAITDLEKLESFDKTQEFITHCCTSRNTCRRLYDKHGACLKG